MNELSSHLYLYLNRSSNSKMSKRKSRACLAYVSDPFSSLDIPASLGLPAFTR